MGSAVLFLVVGLPAMYFLVSIVGSAGIDNQLHRNPVTYYDYATGEYERVFARHGIELVAIPLAAIAAVALRQRMEVIDAPRKSRSLWLPLLGTTAACTTIWLPWLDRTALWVVPLVGIAAGAVPQAARHARAAQRRRLERWRGIAPHVEAPRLAALPAGETIGEPPENNTPWLPWLGAAVAFAVIWYLGWSWSEPPLRVLDDLSHSTEPTAHLVLIGPDEFGVVRWVGAALLAGSAYLGMIFFPRLTAALAGAVAGPALFAVVGYILFPSFMRDPEGQLADTLVIASDIGATVVVTAALFTIAYSEPIRRRPLSYAVWAGAMAFCLAVSGTFNGTYPSA